MKMEYKLLNSNNGVIMTRTPELIGDMLYISFTGAPIRQRLSLNAATARARTGLFLTVCAALRAIGWTVR